MANYQLKDNSAIVFRQLNSNAAQTMDKLAVVLVEAVQEQMMYGYHTPHGLDGHTEIVDTGKLFDSIKADWEKQSQNLFSLNVGVQQGSEAAKYAGYVHNGYYQPPGIRFMGSDGKWYTTKGRHIDGRPFITDGVLNAQETIKEVCAENLPIGFDK